MGTHGDGVLDCRVVVLAPNACNGLRFLLQGLLMLLLARYVWRPGTSQTEFAILLYPFYSPLGNASL